MDKRYPSQVHRLATWDEFEKAVVLRRGWWDMALQICFFAACVLFVVVFISGAMADGSRTWYSLICAFVAVLILAISFSQHSIQRAAKSHLRTIFENYQVAGCVADVHATGVRLPDERGVWTLVCFVDPAVSDRTVGDLMSSLREGLCAAAMSSKANLWRERIVLGDGSGLAWSAIPAHQVDSSFAEGVWLMALRLTNKDFGVVDGVGTRPVVLIRNGTDNAMVLPLQKAIALS